MASSPRWCLDVLGVDAKADHAEVRRAYLQKARETHPDKGGDAEHFRRVVTAFEILAGEGDAGAEEEESQAEEQARGERFSLKEISKLAAQVRALNRERQQAEQVARCGRFEDRETRRRRSLDAAAEGRKRELNTRLVKALAREKRTSLPIGVELLDTKGGYGMGELFRAGIEVDGVVHHAPERRDIAESEEDLCRLQRAARAGTPGVVRTVTILHKKAARAAGAVWRG